MSDVGDLGQLVFIIQSSLAQVLKFFCFINHKWLYFGNEDLKSMFIILL